MTTAVLIVAVAWLAYSNGANDNFKGVATLYGSGAATYRTALVWATGATVAGALLSVALAESLAQKFGGKGFVPQELLGSPALLIAVSLAGAVTIISATWLGLPTSTTHALTGALLGVALVSGGDLKLAGLWANFFQPMLLSPLLAVVGTASLYLILRRIRHAANVTRETCICLGEADTRPVAIAEKGATVAVLTPPSGLSITVGESAACHERYRGRVRGIVAERLADKAHFASAAAVCFSRAVNDTPKIAVLLLAAGGSRALSTLTLVTVAMVLGGLLSARKVAETMSRHITSLNPGQGLTANLITALLVLGASRLGLPVSTTHVSCGSIFGIGIANRKPDWNTITQIALAWLTTLPLAALLGAIVFSLLS
ncbi:MAG: anion permease [Phycisphaerae bacterium]